MNTRARCGISFLGDLEEASGLTMISDEQFNLYMPDTLLQALRELSHLITTPTSEIDTIIILHLHTRKLRLKS